MAPNYGPRIVKDGLVMALDAANPKSYPGTGTTWFDLTNNNLNSTIYLSPTYNSNGYFSFAAGDAWVLMDTTDAATYTDTSFTYEVWFRSTTTSGDSLARIINRDPSDYFAGCVVQNTSSPQDLRIYSQPNNQLFSSQIEVNQWHNLTVTHELNVETLVYLDSVLLNSPGDMPYNGGTGAARNVVLGTDEESGPRAAGEFTGDVSHVKMYNRVLTAQEIQQNYNAFRGRFGL